MSSNVKPSKIAVPAVGVAGACLVVVILAALIPIVKHGVSAHRQWEREMAESLSPFSCGYCGKQLPKNVVLDFSGGAVKGFCPYCRVKILDSLMFTDRSGVNGMEIIAFNQLEIERKRERYGVWTPNWFFFIVVSVVLTIAYIVFMSWFSERMRGIHSVHPSQPDQKKSEEGTSRGHRDL